MRCTSPSLRHQLGEMDNSWTIKGRNKGFQTESVPVLLLYLWNLLEIFNHINHLYLSFEYTCQCAHFFLNTDPTFQKQNSPWCGKGTVQDREKPRGPPIHPAAMWLPYALCFPTCQKHRRLKNPPTGQAAVDPPRMPQTSLSGILNQAEPIKPNVHRAQSPVCQQLLVPALKLQAVATQITLEKLVPSSYFRDVATLN